VPQEARHRRIQTWWQRLAVLAANQGLPGRMQSNSGSMHRNRQAGRGRSGKGRPAAAGVAAAAGLTGAQPRGCVDHTLTACESNCFAKRARDLNRVRSSLPIRPKAQTQSLRYPHECGITTWQSLK
jgi:hypothetical protein